MRLFADETMRSHMPFLFDGGMLFCQSRSILEYHYPSTDQIFELAESNETLRDQLAASGVTQEDAIRYRAWKLHALDNTDQTIRRVETGLAPEDIECSPSMYQRDGRYFVNFVGGISESVICTHRIYQMSGPSLASLSAPRKMASEQLSLGFINSDLIAIKANPDFDAFFYVFDRRTNKSWRCEIPNHFVYRLSFVSNQPRTIVVTLVDFERNPHSYLVTFDTGTCHEILYFGDPVYKCSYLNGRVVFAFRQSGDVEDLVLMDGMGMNMVQSADEQVGFVRQPIPHPAAIREILENLEVTGG